MPYSSIRCSGGGHRATADEAKQPVNGTLRLASEDRRRGLQQRYSVRVISHSPPFLASIAHRWSFGRPCSVRPARFQQRSCPPAWRLFGSLCCAARARKRGWRRRSGWLLEWSRACAIASRRPSSAAWGHRCSFVCSAIAGWWSHPASAHPVRTPRDATATGGRGP